MHLQEQALEARSDSKIPVHTQAHALGEARYFCVT